MTRKTAYSEKKTPLGLKFKSKKMLKSIGTFPVLLALAARLFAQGADIEKKIAMEANLENRLKTVLTEITGTDKLIVIVSLQMVTEKEKKETKKMEDKEILPGVPFQGKIGDVISSSLQQMDMGTERSLIKKITCTLIFDKAISKVIEETAKEVAKGLLGIDDTRGDQLLIQKISFQKNPFYWSDLGKPPHLYYVIGLAFSIVFILGIILFFFGPFQKKIGDIAKALADNAKATAQSAEEKTGGGSAAGFSGTGTGAPVSQYQQSPAAGEKEKKPFDYINPDNIPNVIFALKNQTADKIAVVLNYISSDLSAKIISALPEATQIEVLKKLSGKKEYSRDDVIEIELLLKEKAQFTVGGTEKVTDLASSIDEKVFSAFTLSMKKENPQALSDIEISVIKIQDISNFAAAELSLILREFGLNSFAQVIKSIPAVQPKIIEKLPKGMQDRLKQEIDFLRPVPGKRLAMEKTRLIHLIKRLITEGLIAEIRK